VSYSTPQNSPPLSTTERAISYAVPPEDDACRDCASSAQDEYALMYLPRLSVSESDMYAQDAEHNPQSMHFSVSDTVGR
jgi:hypothetical protein